jgi:ribosomal-protein-alanine N-acetyltransferase
MIRKMRKKDIDEIMIIEEKSFSPCWTRRMFEDEIRIIKSGIAQYFVTEIDEGNQKKIIGYCGVWKLGISLHITTIAIAPEFRGQGYAQELVQTAIHYGCQHNMEEITLEVRISNIFAQNLYKKMDFENIGIRPKYYGNNSEDAIIMTKRI